MPLDINGYNNIFKTFADFAQHHVDANDAKAVAAVSTRVNQLDGRVVGTLSKSKTDEVHKWLRTNDEYAVNDRTRQYFRSAVADMFGGEAKIPASVKKAMLLGDYDAGKPLTARRILAVKAAIDADGTTKALAERQATTERHLRAEPGSDEATLAGIGGRFTANENDFAKGLALFGEPLGQLSGNLSQPERTNVFANFQKAGVNYDKLTKAVYRLALEDVACNGAADLDAGAALFTPANNAAVRLASLEYTGAGFKTVLALAPDRRAALGRILDRFMAAFPPAPREDGRVVVQDDFVRRLAANIDRLAKLDAAGKLDAKTLVKTCYPEVAKPGRFDLGNALFADPDNLESVREFAKKVDTGSFYTFDDNSYTETLYAVADDLRGRLGEDFVPANANFSTLIRGQQLAEDIAGLVDEAIAQNRPVDQDAFGEAATGQMFRNVVTNRSGRAMEQIARAKGLDDTGSSMAFRLLARQPELLETFRAARTPEEAAAALEAIRGTMEAAVDRQLDLQRLFDPAVDTAATLLAGKLGISPDEAKAQVRFESRLREKFSSLADAILRGEHPGCREPGFDPKPLFEKEARKIAGEYIAKFDQIDALQGASDEIKAVWKRDICAERKPSEFDMEKIARFADRLDVAELSGKLADPKLADRDKIDAIKAFCQNVHQAGLETFEDWTTVGVDDKSASVLMALRPALARTPAFKAVLAGILAGENNVFARAVSELERKQQYVGTPLRNMTMES